MRNVGALIVVWGALSCSVYAQHGQPSIVGKWTWTRSTNNCTETYDFRPDGTLYVVSGAERTDNTYAIAFAPDMNGFFRLSLTTTKDYGGRDCADTDGDSTGETSVVYISFHRSGNAHLSCKEPNLKACFGPLRRMDK